MRPLNQQFQITAYDNDGQEVATAYALNTSQAYEIGTALVRSCHIVKIFYEGIGGEILKDTLSK